MKIHLLEFFYIFEKESTEMNIDKIQSNFIFKVDPVNFFEAQRKEPAKSNIFSSGLFAQQTDDVFNPNHPKVAGSATTANRFDRLA